MILPPPVTTEITKTEPPVKKTVTEQGNYVATNNAVETNPNPQADPTPPTQGTEATDGATTSVTGNATITSTVAPPATPFIFASVMPQFEKLEEYLMTHTVYPRQAIELGITGKVYVTFVVDKSGKVTKAMIARGIEGEGGELLEAEALRVVRSMPDWIPGRNNEHPVDVQLTLPINFVIKSN